MVRERRKELMKQVPVRRMDLNNVEAQVCRPGRGFREGVANAFQTGAIEGNRGRFIFCVSNRGWRYGLPAERMVWRKLRATSPRHFRRSLAAGMRELNADRHLRPAAHGFECSPHRGF